jgi:hypothetical protein
MRQTYARERVVDEASLGHRRPHEAEADDEDRAPVAERLR